MLDKYLLTKVRRAWGKKVIYQIISDKRGSAAVRNAVKAGFMELRVPALGAWTRGGQRDNDAVRAV